MTSDLFDPASYSATEFPQGHNNPPPDSTIEALLNPEVVRMNLEFEWHPLAVRREQLIADFERFKADTPAGIKSEEAQGRAADFGKQIKTLIADIEAAHQLAKSPYWKCGLAVDDLKKRLTSDLAAAVSAIEKAMTQYTQFQIAERRRIAAEEAERKRKEMEQAMAAAAAAPTPEMIDNADHAIRETRAAEAAASAPVAELGRARGTYGAVASARKTKEWRISDRAAIPADYWILDEKKINAAVKADIPVPGIEVIESVKTQIR
jgi:hypothetical protein